MMKKELVIEVEMKMDVFPKKIPYNLEENPEIKHVIGSCTQGENV